MLILVRKAIGVQLVPAKRGTVISNFGSHILVKADNKCILNIPVSKKSSFVVGDEVELDTSFPQRLPRKNIIKRLNLKNKEQILAANLDSLAIMVTHEPETKTAFIDSAIICAYSQHINPIIIISKTDLPASSDYVNYITKLFSPQINTYKISTTNGYGIKDLCLKIQQFKRTFIIGNSGVGKSTLINTLIPKAQQKTGELSIKTKLGSHTTTISVLYELDESSEIVDTPGIRDFSTLVRKQEIAYYFAGFRHVPHAACKYRGCMHQSEPGCVIKEALTTGELSEQRYQDYLALVQTAPA